ncbi:MAG: PAS domain S-box protein [Deltaproteobacteria bacterium]|nr:PAS domain S-box protein [Deltaproteobacteria bacterium]
MRHEMGGRALKSSSTTEQLAWIGIGFAMLFWVVESAIHVYIFDEGEFIQQLSRPELHEIWMRLFVVAMFVAFGIYAQAIVSHRRKAEQESRLAHAELNQIFQTAADGMRVIDKDFRVLRANETFLRMSGVSENKAVGEKCYDVFRGPACHTPDCPLTRILDGEKRVEYDAEKQRNDGKAVPCIVTATPFREPEEELIGIVEDFKDISDRKEAEEALRESKVRLKVILDSIQTGVVIIDPETHTIVDVNPVAEKMIGAPKDQIVNKVCHKYICPAEKGKCPITDLGQKADRAERVLTTADGTSIPILKTVGTVFLDGREHLVESFLDITEHKQTEDAVRASEEKYRSLVESTDDSVYLVDSSCSYLFMNQRHLSRFDILHDEVIGSKYGKFHSEEETQAFAKQVEEIMETGKSLWHEYRSERDGGFFLRSLSPVRGTDGRITAVTVISKDITERRRLEAQLQHAQRMEAIGTLAGGIAHNFNNLLMGVRGHLSLMSLDADSGDAVRTRLKKMEGLVESGTQLTSHLLGYAREGRYEVKAINLNKMVTDTSDTFIMTKKHITLHMDLAQDLFGILADHGQIEQVLWNLFVNAGDAMPDGGELFISTANVTHEGMRHRLYAPKPGKYVLLTVTDTGHGMDKKTMERAFDPFYTTKGVGRGTGLGLSSAYGIVKAHGGYVDVESKPGSGTTFKIYFPATEAQVHEVAGTTTELVTGTGTVLLVDDEEAVLEVGKELLEAMGYRVLAARDGSEAVEIYRKNQEDIDIVALDMIMPGMGGGEVFDRLRETDPNVKVLLTSGYAVDGEASKILERGCNGFIQKPFHIKELSEKMSEIINKA